MRHVMLYTVTIYFMHNDSSNNSPFVFQFSFWVKTDQVLVWV